MKATGVFLNKEDAIAYMNQLRTYGVECELRMLDDRYAVYSDSIVGVGIVMTKVEKSAEDTTAKSSKSKKEVK